MIRIFATWQDRVILTAADEHHLVRVLRAQANEAIELLMSDGVYQGQVITTSPLTIQRGERLDSDHELPFRLTLIYPVSKGERMDWVVQKATELGTSELIPCQSDRSVVSWEPTQLDHKFQRYQKIIAEATLQSKRERMMEMHRYLKLTDAIRLPFSHRFLASEIASTTSTMLMDIPHFKRGDHVALIVGPEGGISLADSTLALAQGYLPVSLGKRTLRTETAVTVALGILANKGSRS
jgi:16S rRNA (uracil1498-N3)-methyltransferase